MVRFSLFNFIARPALVGASLALAFAVVPARALEPSINWGPVGPHQPILGVVGNKRIVAFYEPNSGNCDVSAVVFDAGENGGGSESARIRLSLHPGEIFNLDAVQGHRIVLTCAPNAGMLTVLNRGELPAREAHLD
jgi:hypothetical protein